LTQTSWAYGGSDGDAEEADPWIGKSRRAVISLLGEPTKVKTAKDGTRTLTYKLVRLDPNSPAIPGVTLFSLPGVGLVGRYDRAVGMAGYDLAIEPITLDEEGRRTGGGVGAGSQGGGTSWDLGTGEKTSTMHGGEGNPPIRGKLTVKFRIRSDDTVRDWSASGKK
jgi:hypothetical protein